MAAKITPRGPSLRRHPAFPAAIAVWFAALFGLGSLVLRASTLEAAVIALQLDRLIPAAAPPLGFTARLLVALVAACAGAAIGYALARAVTPRSVRAMPRAPQRATTPSAVEPADVAVVSDDNDDLVRLEAARDAQPVRRRRGFMPADLPGEDLPPIPAIVPTPGILKVGELTEVEPLAPSADWLAATDVAEPATPVEPLAGSPEAVAEPEPELAPAPEPVQAVPAAPATPSRYLQAATRAGSAADLLKAAPLASLGVVELVERFAIALAARTAGERLAQRQPAAVANGTVNASFLGRTQLDLPGEPILFHSDPRPDEDPFESPAAAVASGNGRPFDMPAAFRSPLQDGSIDWFTGSVPPAPPEPGKGESLSASQSPGAPGWDLPDPDDDDPDGSDGRADDGYSSSEPGDGFSSLLAMKPTQRTAAIDPLDPTAPLDPPIRLRGPLPSADDAVSEADLRAALLTLQRMNGTA